MYEAKVLADSIAYGTRLTTVMVTLPRFVLAELNTHRVFSRNSASSRAIPVETRCTLIEASPFVPDVFGKNQRGMQSTETLDEEANGHADMIWREAVADAVRHARRLAAVDVHKQYANRIPEFAAWHTVIITSTEWDNWRALRISPKAQPEIRRGAEVVDAAMRESTPQRLRKGEWHVPLMDTIAPSFTGFAELAKISVARCARVSYDRQLDKKTLADDIALHDMLLSSGHMSPFEHQARVEAPATRTSDEVDIYGPPFGASYDATPSGDWRLAGYFAGNLRAPFLQYRKMLPGERVFSGGA